MSIVVQPIDCIATQCKPIAQQSEKIVMILPA